MNSCLTCIVSITFLKDKYRFTYVILGEAKNEAHLAPKEDQRKYPPTS